MMGSRQRHAGRSPEVIAMAAPSSAPEPRWLGLQSAHNVEFNLRGSAEQATKLVVRGEKSRRDAAVAEQAAGTQMPRLDSRHRR